MTAPGNKHLVAEAFDAWARGGADVFHLLADDAMWTLTGTSPLAGTYTSRQWFLDQVIAPLEARLSEPIRPTVQSIVAEGDWVVVLWRGHATALDGRPYDNAYSWHMRFDGESIVEVIAFLDGQTLTELFDRVRTPSHPTDPSDRP